MKLEFGVSRCRNEGTVATFRFCLLIHSAKKILPKRGTVYYALHMTTEEFPDNKNNAPYYRRRMFHFCELLGTSCIPLFQVNTKYYRLM